MTEVRKTCERMPEQYEYLKDVGYLKICYDIIEKETK